ncbi:MAG TPA: pyruvate kinase alpha/beta domain-containing protein, partial [bacterium]|nr:pyruvate kinase alpha/beta domain-containing protein [bacterium]
DAILREAEAYLWAEKKFFVNIHQTKYNDILRKAISISIAQLSRDLDAHCIAVLTRSGDTARIVSADRPAAPIIAFTKSEKTYRQMNLLWGVFPFLVKREFKFKEYINYAQCVVINELKIAKKNDYIILLSGLAGDNTSLDSIVIHKIT